MGKKAAMSDDLVEKAVEEAGSRIVEVVMRETPGPGRLVPARTMTKVLREVFTNLIAAAEERGRWGPCPSGCNDGVSRERDVLGPCFTCHGKGEIRRELAGTLEEVDAADLQTVPIDISEDWLTGYKQALKVIREQAREKWGNQKEEEE
jgi:hypothetical protein